MSSASICDHLTLNAEDLYAQFREGIRSFLEPTTQLVGVISGGVWLAERLSVDLALPHPINSLSSSMHRDDYQRRGVAATATQTKLAFDVNHADILLLDDVLYTGRTIRAVMNELFDYGRPARIRLAVLVDRGDRQLPIRADYYAARISLPATQKIALARESDAVFQFAIEDF